MSNKIMTCIHCGSPELSVDATARWCVETQSWELSGVFDCKTCDDCGREFDDEPSVVLKPD